MSKDGLQREKPCRVKFKTKKEARLSNSQVLTFERIYVFTHTYSYTHTQKYINSVFVYSASDRRWAIRNIVTKNNKKTHTLVFQTF